MWKLIPDTKQTKGFTSFTNLTCGINDTNAMNIPKDGALSFKGPLVGFL